jgi:hypothetical protein
MFVTFGWLYEKELVEGEATNQFGCIFAESNTLRGNLNLQKIAL